MFFEGTSLISSSLKKKRSSCVGYVWGYGDMGMDDMGMGDMGMGIMVKREIGGWGQASKTTVLLTPIFRK